MANSLKITADTSPVKKSLLELSKSVKDLGSSKISIFSNSERKFIKTEMKKELSLIKQKLKDNKTEINKMIDARAKLKRGTKEELELHKKITQAMKVQAQLARESQSIQGRRRMSMPSMGKLGGLIGAGIGLAGGAVLAKGIQASNQYQQGIGNRVRLSGLGVSQNSGVGANTLAGLGLSEQEFASRRVSAISRLGRAGATNQSLLQQAQTERSFGLEGGTFSGIANSLRGNFGGAGANEAQMKLQASILSSGIEDAIAPYLESATALLSEINENGVTQTDELVNMLGKLTADGKRTPEQIARIFKGVDSAIKGSSGESNAFLQSAFARAGIGNNTIGGTRLAISSGGLFGLDRNELKKRGYSDNLIQNMESMGMLSGAKTRSGAILNQLKQSGGLGLNQSLGSADANQMVGISNLANSIFGTQGNAGLDAALMLEQVQKGNMSQKTFESKLKDLKEGKNPGSERLKEINSTLAGSVEVAQKLNQNLMEKLGENTVQITKKLLDVENAILSKGNATIGEAVDSMTPGGMVGAVGGAAAGGTIGATLGPLGAMAGAVIGGVGGYFMGRDTNVDKRKNIDLASNMDKAKKAQSNELNTAISNLSRSIDKISNPNVNVVNKNVTNVTMPDGKVSKRTY